MAPDSPKLTKQKTAVLTEERSRKAQELKDNEDKKQELRQKFGRMSANFRSQLARDERPPGFQGRVHEVVGSGRFETSRRAAGFG